MDYEKVSAIEYLKEREKLCLLKCMDCPLSISNNGYKLPCRNFEQINPLEAIKTVMNYEPKIDWSKVKVDTKILVRNNVNDEWTRRYFAKYENGIVYAYDGGKTSFSANDIIPWNFAKLYEGEE